MKRLFIVLALLVSCAFAQSVKWPEEKANDLIHWQTRFLRDSAGDAASLRAPLVELPDGRAGFRKAVTVRDPDGHAIQIVEQ